MGFRAIVQEGRLRLDEKTSLPEGTVLDLVVDDEGDDLDDLERDNLEECLEESVRQARAGQLIPASDVIEEMRRRR